MRRKANQTKKTKIENLVFLCLITTMIVATITLSKYQTTVAGSDSTKVATPVITLSSNVLNIKMSPINNVQEYVFSVSNTEEEKTSEVSMGYTLQVKTMQNLPLDFELYTYDNSVQGTQNLFENSGSITNSEITIDMETGTTHTYKLKIIWKEDNNNYKFSNEIEYIQLILNGSQVD